VKILQVMAGAVHGGAETAFVDMCLALKAEGHDIVVVTRPHPVRVPVLQEAGIIVHTLPFAGKLDFITAWRMRKIIAKFQPQIVQTWMSRAPLYVPRWNPESTLPRYAVVARLGSPYKFKYFKNADYFVAITPDIRAYLIAQGVRSEQVMHINNFAEVEPVHTTLSRKDYNIPEDAFLVLGLGRLHAAKAFDTLIAAIAQLPDVYLWIAGEGPERKNLEVLIAALGLDTRVKLLGWQTDRAALFQASDLCAFISRVEGFGTVFVQSWAQHVPVVVCDADGPRQFVRHEEDGLMGPMDDVEAIATSIKRLRDDPVLRDRLVQNGFMRYEAEFTKAACVQAYLSYYETICGSFEKRM